VAEPKEDLNNAWSTQLKWNFLQVWRWDPKFRNAKLGGNCLRRHPTLVSLEITKTKMQARKSDKEREASSLIRNEVVRKEMKTNNSRPFNRLLLAYIGLLCILHPDSNYLSWNTFAEWDHKTSNYTKREWVQTRLRYNVRRRGCQIA
jgi:hypothetical protein